MTGSCRGGLRPPRYSLQRNPAMKASRSARPSPSAARGRRRGGATAPSRTDRVIPRGESHRTRGAQDPWRIRAESVPGARADSGGARAHDRANPSRAGRRAWSKAAPRQTEAAIRAIPGGAGWSCPRSSESIETPTRSSTNREPEQFPMRSTRHASRYRFAYREKIDLLQTIRELLSDGDRTHSDLL
jgi:hypothetical protein